jgi:nucleoside transporter
MISPFFVGLIADRYFASEKLLAVFGILGGLTLCLLPLMETFGTFYLTLILYCALYVPTLALGNSLSLHHLADPKADFPRVKVMSAVGWIAGGIVLSLLAAEQRALQFYVAGAASMVFGVFALTLPHTPPRKTGADVRLGEVLGLDALALMKKPSFAIFIACMFLICIPLYFYFVMMGIYLTELQWSNMAAKMTLAQVSDVVFLLLLPFFLKTLGYKKTIFIGILAWALRYFALAGSVHAAGLQAPLIFAAILMHGVCYDFLFIAGQLYVDDEANERIRGAAQGFIAFVTLGVGMFIGSWLSGRIVDIYTVETVKNWQAIWMAPAIMAGVVLVLFALFFKDGVRSAPADG